MNIFGMGPMELLLIVVLALIVFGPARLPEIMAQIGKGINDFRRATSELSDEFNKTIQAELQETRAAVDEAKSAVTEARSAVTDVHATVNSAVTGMPAPTRTAVPASQDALPAPNGTTIEPGTNGTLPAVVPPIAETVPWSWETSAPAEPKTTPADGADVADAPTTRLEPPTESTEAPAAESAPAAPSEQPEPASTIPPAPPTPKERAARDELAPPY